MHNLNVNMRKHHTNEIEGRSRKLLDNILGKIMKLKDLLKNAPRWEIKETLQLKTICDHGLDPGP